MTDEELKSSGRICEAIGHAWKLDQKRYVVRVTYVDGGEDITDYGYTQDYDKRTCTICGEHQEQKWVRR